jgi:hypothetical protein
MDKLASEKWMFFVEEANDYFTDQQDHLRWQAGRQHMFYPS